jgi:hypothetical protein
MSDSLRRCSGSNRRLLLCSALAGLAAGGALASGVFLILMNEQEKRHREELEVAFQVGVPTKNPKDEPAGKPVSPEEKQVLEIGKELVRDLEKSQYLRVYRSTTTAFQQKTGLQTFLKSKVPTLKRLVQMEDCRECKLRSLKDKKGYEFYFTAEEIDAPKVVNIFFVLVSEGGEWRVSELEVSRADQRG